MQHDKINILDDILKYFYDNRLNNITVHNIWRNFANTDKEFYLLIIDLESDGLIYKSSTKTYTNPAMNLYRITSEGIKVFEAGGIEQKYKEQLKKKEKEAIRENMEYDKLSSEIIDLNNKIKDYSTVKLQAFWGMIIGFFGLLLAILTFFFRK